MEDENGKAISPVGYLPVVSASSSEVELMARIMQGEAGFDNAEGLAAVGWCIMHRVSTAGFPDTLEGVIYQDGQFTGVGTTNFNTDPNTFTLNIARGVLSGTLADPVAAKNVLPGPSLYFQAEDNYNDYDWATYPLVNIGGNVFSAKWYWGG